MSYYHFQEKVEFFKEKRVKHVVCAYCKTYVKVDSKPCPNCGASTFLDVRRAHVNDDRRANPQ